MAKQVIVVRKDLKKMNEGKAIAQGAHASLGAFLLPMNGGKSLSEQQPIIKDGKYKLSMEVEVGSETDQWLRGIFTKVTLAVQSEEELLEIYEKAKDKGLAVELIEDIGLTAFNGVKTKTCLAIGPDSDEKINEVTGHLPLFK